MNTKKVPTIETLGELGFTNFSADRWRVTEWPKGKCLGEFRAFWNENNWNLERVYTDHGPCLGQNDAVLRLVIKRATEQGYDAYLCDNKPRHGGSIV